MLAVALATFAHGADFAVPQDERKNPAASKLRTIAMVECLADEHTRQVGQYCRATYDCSGDTGALWEGLHAHNGRRVTRESDAISNQRDCVLKVDDAARVQFFTVAAHSVAPELATLDTELAGQSAVWLRFDSACYDDRRCVWAKGRLAQRGIKIRPSIERPTAWLTLTHELAHLAAADAGIVSAEAYLLAVRDIRAAVRDCGGLLPAVENLPQLGPTGLDVPMQAWLRCVTKTCDIVGNAYYYGDACRKFAPLLGGDVQARSNPCYHLIHHRPKIAYSRCVAELEL